MPHHVIQRGNRRQQTFFGDDDYRAYLDLMAEWCPQHKVQVRAYCLMPNHVHLIVVPKSADTLARAIGEAHRRYTRRVNFREGWRGHLWQGRLFRKIGGAARFQSSFTVQTFSPSLVSVNSLAVFFPPAATVIR
ncbi:MAG TPA: transposase [Thermoguttaceae bacterium]|nr:transposase [Thermoguttaceae bacterium]